MPSSQSVAAVQAIAATFNETWTQAKINQVATQLDRGQRTPTGVIQDIEARGGQRATTPTVPTTGQRTGADGGSQIIMVSPTGVTTVVGPGEVAALQASGWTWPTAQQQAAADETARQAGASVPGAPRPPSSTVDAATLASIIGILRTLGLEELQAEVDALVRQGLTWPEIENMLNDPTSSIGRVVDRIYPELREYREANPGMPPINIAAIQQYREGLNQMVSVRGLSEAFPDVPGTARRWITQGKSLVEIGERLDLLEGQVAGLAANPVVQSELDAWERFYGVRPTLQNLVALTINPEESVPRLQRKFASVALDVSAGRQGFGDLAVNEAERLADAGVDVAQAGQTFGALAANRELFSPLERNEDEITRDEQLNAGFSLGNADAARRRIEQRRGQRVGRFAGGGGISTGRDGGMAGLATNR